MTSPAFRDSIESARRVAWREGFDRGYVIGAVFVAFVWVLVDVLG